MNRQPALVMDSDGVLHRNRTQRQKSLAEAGKGIESQKLDLEREKMWEAGRAADEKAWQLRSNFSNSQNL